MTARLISMRDAVHARLLLDQLATLFVFNDFDVEKTFVPYEKVAAMAADHPSGKIYVISSQFGDYINASRANRAIVQELPVQLGYQRADVDYDDETTVEQLVELVEQLQDMCRLRVDLDGYSFARMEMLKDENDVPFSFIMMREARTFEAYFTAVYNTTLS